MATERDELSYPELVEALHQHCLAKHTGTWIAATRDNHSLRVGIDGGNIVKVVYLNLKGQEALNHVRKISGGWCNFTKDVLPAGPMDTELPETRQILQFLAQGSGRAAGSSPTTGIPVDLVKEVIIDEATELLGPMGPTICEECFDNVGDMATKAGLVGALSAISTEIGDEDKAEAFKKSVLVRLTKNV